MAPVSSDKDQAMEDASENPFESVGKQPSAPLDPSSSHPTAAQAPLPSHAPPIPAEDRPKSKGKERATEDPTEESPLQGPPLKKANLRKHSEKPLSRVAVTSLLTDRAPPPTHDHDLRKNPKRKVVVLDNDGDEPEQRNTKHSRSVPAAPARIAAPGAIKATRSADRVKGPAVGSHRK